MPHSQNNMNDIFLIEADKKILSYRNGNDEPIWMYMRYNVMYNVVLKLFNNVQTVKKARAISSKTAKYIIKAAGHNCLTGVRKKASPVAFYCPGDGFSKNGKYYNRFADQLRECLDTDSLLFENAALSWKWPESRSNNNVYYYAPAFTLQTIQSSPSSSDLEKTRELVDYVADRIKVLYDADLSERDKEDLVSETAREMVRCEKHAKWLLRQCKKKKISLLIMVGGSYSKYYAINRVLKKNGIRVADLQHGYITETNVVYNYNEALLDTEDVKTATPEFFLTYGKWWGKRTNLPYKQIVEVGNPYRSYASSNYVRDKSNDIMIIGCARETAFYCSLADELGKRFKDRKVVFRPHPSERLTAASVATDSGNFVIDNDRPIYTALSESEVVISEISTVLFEAIGLVKKIIVWSNDFSKYSLPECPFATAESVEELITAITEGPTDKNAGESDFWASNWEENFRSFVKTYV